MQPLVAQPAREQGMPVLNIRALEGTDVQIARRSAIGSRINAAAIRELRSRFVMPRPTTLIDGVFEGGAALGTAYVGSLRALGDNTIWFKRVAGNSAGAITAAMIAAGYNAVEIQWLTSNFPDRGKPPDSLPPGLIPIDFKKFLDRPLRASDFPTATRRSTLLWKLLKGQIIDDVLNQTLRVPTRNSLANTIAAGVVAIPGIPNGLTAPIADVVRPALSFLPDSQPHLRDLVPGSLATVGLRETFADRLWNVIADNNPVYRLWVNLVYEGGIFDGKVLLDTMNNLVKAKFPHITGVVLLRHLTIPLAVISADTDASSMVVLSAAKHPNMPVAEAVRRSMSIPFMFQPRMEGTHEIMDGGLCSNYPFWLFSAAGQELMPVGDPVTDAQRHKIGFILEDHDAAPAAWNAEPPVFTDSQGRAAEPSPLDALARNVGLDLRQAGDGHFEAESIERIFRVLDVMDKKEEFLREKSAQTLMGTSPYHEVHIPVKGFHWLDFTINSDEDIFCSIADRGWQATIDTLKTAGLIRASANPKSPYRP
jgi:predicted acylesterase/phospholipase RssA